MTQEELSYLKTFVSRYLITLFNRFEKKLTVEMSTKQRYEF